MKDSLNVFFSLRLENKQTTDDPELNLFWKEDKTSGIIYLVFAFRS